MCVLQSVTIRKQCIFGKFKARIWHLPLNRLPVQNIMYSLYKVVNKETNDI